MNIKLPKVSNVTSSLSLLLTIVISLFLPLKTAFANNLDDTINSLQYDWAIANYKTSTNDLEKVFQQLTTKAKEAVNKFPNNAEPLIWKAIIISSDAGKNGGFSALGKVKDARILLLKAEKIDPNVLNGSVYTSLGSLYYQVPGWPIGFGDDEQAEIYLKKALALNPEGIDSNYFYGDFLLENGHYAEAKKYLHKASNAAARKTRPLADQGRREEIAAKLKIIERY